jgi:hypothetical protein
MKRLSVLAVMVISLPLFLIGQQHFSWTENTGNNATIAVLLSTEITVNGSTVQPGDEIGVFTPDGLCVGGIVWEGNKNQPLTVWGNNALTQDIKDGINVGETMYFKVWRHQHNTEHDIVAVEYESGSGIYEVNGLYVLRSLTSIPKPDVPELIDPGNGSEDISPHVLFTWNASSWAGFYVFQVATDNSFTTILAEQEVQQTGTELELDFATMYYWRVRAVNIAGTSEWSGTRSFTTKLELFTIGIPLRSGWNMISSHVRLAVTEIHTLFDGVDDPDLFIKNNAGYSYWPAMEIFDLSEWNIYEGYQVHMSRQHVLSISGTKIDPPATPINLPKGWNIIPYFLESTALLTDALQSIQDQIVVVKDIHGDIYWPAYEVNTLGNLQPGQGYQVYLSADAELAYPASAEKIVSSESTVRSASISHTLPMRYNSDFRNTGSNSTLLIHSPDFENLDEIGVWTSSGKLVGNGVVNNGRAVISVWGNNPATPDVIDGAVEDEELRLTVWSSAQDMEQELTLKNIVNVLETNEKIETLTFRVNGLHVASVDRPSYIDREEVALRYSLAQNYPNPFNPTTQIRFSIRNEEHVRLTVYSLVGQEVAVLIDEQRPAGIYTVDFDATGLSSGVFFYRLDAGAYRETRRMIMSR